MLSNAIASRASHHCMRVTCKQCMARIAVTALRTMATKPARQETSIHFVPSSWLLEEMEISKLAKPLELEITHQKRLIREENLTIERVLEDYSRLIRENQISVLFFFV
jgi:hypothetical protein